MNLFVLMEMENGKYNQKPVVPNIVAEVKMRLVD